MIAVVAPLGALDVAAYALKAVIVVLVLLAALRLLGKRHAGSYNVYDIAMLMAASNAVQNAMTGGRGNLVVGLAVSAAIVVTAWVVTRAVVRSPRLHLVVVGSPTVLVSRGVVLEQRLRRQHVSHEDLAAAMRSHGVDRLDQVRLAVLEPNGEISIVPTADVESSEVPEDPLDPPDAIG